MPIAVAALATRLEALENDSFDGMAQPRGILALFEGLLKPSLTTQLTVKTSKPTHKPIEWLNNQLPRP
jgi:hypothetical protein